MRVVLLLTAAALCSAQSARLSPQDRQSILEYPLTMQRTNQLIAAVPAMAKYIVAMRRDVQAKSLTLPRSQQIVNMEKDPQAMEILKQNGLTAKDYIIGVPALRMALMVAGGQPQSDAIVASPANLAFAKANLKQLEPRWDAAENGFRPTR